jgi:YVTN family beta-propeller protein
LLVVVGCTGPDQAPKELVAVAPPAPAELIYVTDETAGNVVVVDPAAGVVVATIPVGKRPRGAHLSSDGTQLLVALSGSPIAPPGVDESTLPPADRSADGIGVVDLATRKLARVLPSGQDPETFDISADGRTAYLSNEETAEMSALDLASGTIVGRVKVGEEPEGVTIRPGGKEVYVTAEGDGMVYVVETAALKVVAKIKAGDRPRSVAFSPDGATAFVTGENSSTLAVVDTSTHNVIKMITIPLVGNDVALTPRPMHAVTSLDGKRIYVSLGRGAAVAVVDATNHTLIKQITGVGTRVWGMSLSKDGRKLYTANGRSGDVTVIDLTTDAIDKKIQVGSSPWGVTSRQ